MQISSLQAYDMTRHSIIEKRQRSLNEVLSYYEREVRSAANRGEPFFTFNVGTLMKFVNDDDFQKVFQASVKVMEDLGYTVLPDNPNPPMCTIKWTDPVSSDYDVVSEDEVNPDSMVLNLLAEKPHIEMLY